ncbi:MAG: aminotransferase class I/II-fold pyridoxal phosphate-dependent enzyme [candidate division Zixibacteria bacterium]|nr:aminotransferase class I/II-fold pyridoxal phosphate-dependent enzyme [candidate division Zixibacteria bacterium]
MDKHDDTRTVQSGPNAHKYEGAVTVPIFTTSTFAFESSDAVEAYNRDPSGHYLYTRYANPTIVAVEQTVADLERAEASLLFASGMAAITSSVLAIVRNGDKIVTTPSLYGGTRKFFRDILPRYGIEVAFAPGNAVDDVRPLIDSRTKLLYLESPANPHAEVLDVKALAATAKERGIVSAIDATFATPILMKPYVIGIDLVIHSCTKYLGGHADLIGGVVSSNLKTIKKVEEYRRTLGGVIDPEGASRVGRGLKTLAVRMDRHCANGMQVAQALQKSEKVTELFYPGLPDSPWHTLAKEQMTGFGGMICLTLRGGLPSAKRFVDALRLIINAPSLGGVESLASIPVLTSHVNMSPEELRLSRVNEGMVRLSIGIESATDLIADVLQALAAV